MFETAPSARPHHLLGDLVLHVGVVADPIRPRLGGVAIQLLALPLLQDSLVMSQSQQSHTIP